MPLVYEKAKGRREMIATNLKLEELEISGFVKCIARARCEESESPTERIQNLCKSLKKQYESPTERIQNLCKSLKKQYEDALQGIILMTIPNHSRDVLEALADLRNVAGLLFLELEGE